MWEKLLAKIMWAALAGLTPALKDAIKAFVLDFREKAAATKNPYDDILADILCSVLGID